MPYNAVVREGLQHVIIFHLTGTYKIALLFYENVISISSCDVNTTTCSMPLLAEKKDYNEIARSIIAQFIKEACR